MHTVYRCMVLHGEKMYTCPCSVQVYFKYMFWAYEDDAHLERVLVDDSQGICFNCKVPY